jgi:hypothetical protein
LAGRDLPIIAANRADIAVFYGMPLENLPIFCTLVQH